jgi:hypothetical protein
MILNELEKKNKNLHKLLMLLLKKRCFYKIKIKEFRWFPSNKTRLSKQEKEPYDHTKDEGGFVKIEFFSPRAILEKIANA